MGPWLDFVLARSTKALTDIACRTATEARFSWCVCVGASVCRCISERAPADLTSDSAWHQS